MSEEKIILYSTNGCQQCRGLKMLLDRYGFIYETNTDVEYMISEGFLSTPILEVDGERMANVNAVKWVNERAKTFENR